MPAAASPARAPLQLPSPLCVAIAGATPRELLANAEAQLPAWPFQELRLDFLPDPAAGLPAVAALLHAHPAATCLATCRPQRSGGHFAGDAPAELALLLAAARAGFPLVDLSLESAEQLGPPALAQLRAAGARVLLSFHDFTTTPNLPAVLARITSLAPDLAKIIPTSHSLTDALTTLAFLRAHSAGPIPLIALAMGEHGAITRILGPSCGAPFTFGAATDAGATAPGQLTAHTLTSLYRLPSLTPATRLFAVAGDPIRSSLSPRMLNTAFQHAGLDAVYLPLLTASAPELLRAARQLPLHGFSITMPLKQAILPLLDAVDPLAARIGAVNTVRRTPTGHLHGFNTDAAGIVTPLERRLPLRNARVLVLGAGGAARAAVFACLDRGAHVYITNRTPKTALALAADAGATALPRESLATQTFDVLINSTPAGMANNPQTLPLAPEELQALHAPLVFDLVYNPLETPLLALARAQGRQVIPGLEMFLHQGARQFELWTGQPAPLETMHAAVLAALTP